MLLYILVLRIGRAVGSAADLVRAIHGATIRCGIVIACVEKRLVRVSQIVSSDQPAADRSKRDLNSRACVPVILDVRALPDQHRILEKIIRGTILLNDDHHVLDQSTWLRACYFE